MLLINRLLLLSAMFLLSELHPDADISSSQFSMLINSAKYCARREEKNKINDKKI